MKKTIAVFLVLILSVMPIGMIQTDALDPTYSVSGSYASSTYYTKLRAVNLTGNQRDDILNVAWSQYGYHEGNSTKDLGGTSSGSSDYTEFGYWYGTQVLNNSSGFYDQWCAMFVSWCARQAGISTSILQNSARAGHGASCFNINFYSGSSTLASSSDDDSYFKGYNYSPKEGDLFFTRSWNHVGLVASVSGSTFTTIEGNSSYKVSSNTYSISDYYFGVPDYKETPTLADDLPDADTFYAKIINTKAWMDLTNDNPTVSSRDGTNNSNQYWYFVRNPDMSYCIRSTSDGRYLTAAGTSSGSNIQVAEWSESDSQYWWITGGSDHYVLFPKSSSCVITLPNASKEEGTNIQLETRAISNDDAQLFQIYTLDDYVMSTNVRTSQHFYVKGSDITITWSECFDAATYWIDIWKAGADGSAATHIHSLSFSQDSHTYSFTMPSVQNGNYTVYASSGKDGSESVWHFTVADNARSDTPVVLGDDFYAVILTKNAWKPIANDYETDNLVRLQTGEHEKSSAHQLWRFQRQNDGTYVIRSVQDGNCLGFSNAQYGVRAENDPVSAQEPWSNYARQKWWIYESSNGGYFFESYHYSSEGWYMTLKDDNSEDGTPITMCSFKTSNDNQTWGIYGRSEVQLKAPTPTVDASTASDATQFSWDHVFGAKEFQVNIWKNQYDETKAPDYTETVTTTSNSIQLPAGTYVVSVTARNYWQSYTSQIVPFTVNDESYQITVTGDVDGDGKLVLKDVTVLVRYLAGGWGVTIDSAAADVNHDGKVDLRDVAILRRYLAGGWDIIL